MMYRSFVLGDAARTLSATKRQRFAMPVRFILSAHDAYIPPQYAEDAPRTGDDVDAFVQDRTGHFLPDEDPAYTAEQIRAWVLPHAQPLRSGFSESNQTTGFRPLAAALGASLKAALFSK